MPAKLLIERLHAVDEVHHMLPGIGAARWRAKVRAAAKGAVRIDAAPAVPAQQGAGPLWMRSQFFPAAGAHSLRGEQRLDPCHHRRLSGLPEMAAAGAHFALPWKRARLHFGIDCLEPGEQRLVVLLHAETFTGQGFKARSIQ